MDVFCIGGEQDLENFKIEIEKDGFALVFIAEEIARKYQAALEPLFQRTMPAMVVMPGAYGSSGWGAKDLMRSLDRSLGSSKVLG